MTERHFEFHVSRQSRDHYQFDQSIFQITGNVVFANFHAARVFAQRMNDKRDLVNYPEQAVKAGQINAMGLIDEIGHLLIENYRRKVNPNVMQQALQSLNEQFGGGAVDKLLQQFSQEFPPVAVYQGKQTLEEWFNGTTDGVPHRELALEELMMLWVANQNPAFSPYVELFDDHSLEDQTAYPQVFPALQTFFAGQPGITPTGEPGGESLLDALLAPAKAAPHSLTAQLEFLRQKWGVVLGKFLYRLLSSLDLIQEESKVVFAGVGGGPGGPGPAQVLEFAGLEEDPERYTLDRDWMPRLVLIAKNAYVWLDQLSRQYERPITHLDEVPDEELDRLARFGFTGLWLIGLWERSIASRTMKQLMGNQDAVASAYSLLDYQIAGDLGGEAAVDNLRRRAWQRGIRLASDMVPNHMGIDSTWVMEHPDWFISLPYSPFPSYSFNGQNLSSNENVGIYLEDHYYNQTDAAVVFKRVDHNTGDTRYIYHGNDGTTMPWNDTAQLNYLMAEVREAVIQTILHVARQFPIIRFDAAMTLAKRHIQRLWFPEPGTGGAIASRSEFGLPRQQFDELIPQEFWREVVDRAAVEAPDTLLLAEAFWMLEGYFVRTLGMHRVYNSAFMHMTRDEENAKYRVLIKNTLDFDPEILQRYVNFMNNPDEKTAVEQFGKGDKYFGICTLMLTLPGLPMFGHGQIEGYAEKYGMEYRRAYWDERPDQWLVERHEREIVPLIHKRYLFAEVANFRLYDFTNTDGSVNEDVFAYSNRAGEERSLVIVHNKYASARGWIKTSVPFIVKRGEERSLIQNSLGEGMAIGEGSDLYTIFRDQATDLEYIRPNGELRERGLYLELNAYQRHVFLDFREVSDDERGYYRNLVEYLGGQGVPSINEALRETFVQPIHRAYRALVNADLFRRILALRPDAAVINEFPAFEDAAEETVATPNLNEVPADSETETASAASSQSATPATGQAGTVPVKLDKKTALLDEIEEKVVALAGEIKTYTEGTGDEATLAEEIRADLETLLQIETLPLLSSLTGQPGYTDITQYIRASLGNSEWAWGVLLTWLFTHSLGKLVTDTDYEAQSRSWVDEWLLRKPIAATLQALEGGETEAARGVLLVKSLISQEHGFLAQAGETNPAYRLVEAWFKDEAVRGFIGVNRYEDVLYYNKEAFDQLLGLLLLAAVLDTASQKTAESSNVSGQLTEVYAIVRDLRQAQADANYRVNKLLAILSGEPEAETETASEPEVTATPASNPKPQGQGKA